MRKTILILGLTSLFFSCSDIKKNNINEKGNTPIIEEEINRSKAEKGTVFSQINEGDLFEINNLKCYWKSDSVFRVKEKDTIPLWRINRALINSTNKEVILSLDSEDGSVYENNGEGSFKDLNLDGFKDFMMYSEENSGSGGSYYNTFIFNSEKNIFEFSKLHSGGVLTLDVKKRTLKSTWRSGVSTNIYKILYFDNKGNIQYRENIVTEIGESIDSEKYKLTTTYQKFINDKLV